MASCKRHFKNCRSCLGCLKKKVPKPTLPPKFQHWMCRRWHVDTPHQATFLCEKHIMRIDHPGNNHALCFSRGLVEGHVHVHWNQQKAAANLFWKIQCHKTNKIVLLNRLISVVFQPGSMPARVGVTPKALTKKPASDAVGCHCVFYGVPSGS